VPIRGVIDFRAAFHSEGCSLYFARDTSSTLPLSRASREAAKPVYEADRHAKKELKKQVRGVRPIERVVEQRNDDAAAIIRRYCSAVRSALTDDGHPPLSAPGLKLHERLTLLVASLERVAKKGACQSSLSVCTVF
jgi:hypothetical protein